MAKGDRFLRSLRSLIPKLLDFSKFLEVCVLYHAPSRKARATSTSPSFCTIRSGRIRRFNISTSRRITSSALMPITTPLGLADVIHGWETVSTEDDKRVVVKIQGSSKNKRNALFCRSFHCFDVPFRCMEVHNIFGWWRCCVLPRGGRGCAWIAI